MFARTSSPLRRVYSVISSSAMIVGVYYKTVYKTNRPNELADEFS